MRAGGKGSHQRRALLYRQITAIASGSDNSPTDRDENNKRIFTNRRPRMAEKIKITVGGTPK